MQHETNHLILVQIIHQAATHSTECKLYNRIEIFQLRNFTPISLTKNFLCKRAGFTEFSANFPKLSGNCVPQNFYTRTLAEISIFQFLVG